MSSLAWTDLGMIPGLCAKVRSSEFRHVCYRINILGSQLSPSSINLVLVQAGKVTVGLASHWPCVTDTVVYPPTGSTAKDREMSTHAYAPSGRGTIYLYLLLLCTDCQCHVPSLIELYQQLLKLQ